MEVLRKPNYCLLLLARIRPGIMSLPVAACLAELRAALSASGAVLLTAETGSGKTTWLPLQLLDEPWLQGQKIIMLEPRRVAARAAANRLAFHLGESVGKTVGYSVRFDSKVSSATRLEVVTEGILARRIVSDPGLAGIGLIIFDEFHERHVETDLALALALEARSAFRGDLRLLVMSATIDTAALSRFFQEQLGGAVPSVAATGTNFPVAIRYHEAQLATPRYGDAYSAQAQHGHALAEACARQALEAVKQHEGDVLIFLPGVGEIETAIELIAERRLPNTDILPLYGDLSAAEQDKVLSPPQPGRRRIIVSTPIAESSLTVEGLTVVIDSGLVREPRFDPGSGLAHLTTAPVTQDSAVQRAGRAGRLAPGTCYRMYSEADFKRRPKTRVPELLRSDLADASLRCLAFGSALRSLALIDRPGEAMLLQAENLLRDLGSIDPAGKLTELGAAAAKMPLPPRLAVMLLKAPSPEAAMLAAMLSERDAFSLKGPDSTDLGFRLNQVAAYFNHGYLPVGIDRRVLQNVERIYRQLSASLPKGEPNAETERALLCAYPDRICIRRETGSFLMRGGRGVSVEKGDHNAGEEFLLAVDLAGGKENAKLRLGLAVDRATVLAHFRDAITEHETIREINGKPRAFRETRLDALLLSEKEIPLPEGYSAGLIWQKIRTSGVENLMEDAARQFCIRAEICRQGDASLPSFDFAELTVEAEAWLAPFLIPGPAYLEALRARLNYAQLKLVEEKTPERLTMPSGAAHRVHYAPGKATLSVRIQEVFGLASHPQLAGGALPLALELLSPGKQPIAVTMNIAEFWKKTYSEVRKEMRGRYPKHFWPEDPLSMQGTTGTKKAFDRRQR